MTIPDLVKPHRKPISRNGSLFRGGGGNSKSKRTYSRFGVSVLVCILKGTPREGILQRKFPGFIKWMVGPQGLHSWIWRMAGATGPRRAQELCHRLPRRHCSLRWDGGRLRAVQPPRLRLARGPHTPLFPTKMLRPKKGGGIQSNSVIPLV